jgi:hypothetical protein
MAIKCKERVLKFWIQILKSNESPIHNLYRLQFNETVSDPNCNNWAVQVKSVLDDLGCTDAWLHQSNMGYNFQYFKTRLQDQFRQSWSTQINACSKLDYYRMFKTTFEMETYLTSI